VRRSDDCAALCGCLLVIKDTDLAEAQQGCQMHMHFARESDLELWVRASGFVQSIRPNTHKIWAFGAAGN